MNGIAVLDHWLLRDFDPGAGEAALAFDGDVAARGEDGWIGAAVPGDVHVALLEAGRIEDPFYDRNELACRWIEEREWWYRTEFDAAGPEPDERLRLVFSGLDTFATIWLNGEELGRTDNAFREFAFDATERVRSGRNTLAVRLEPPVARLAGSVPFPPPFGSAPGEWRNRIRTAQFGYGWDWGPRLPPLGIWRPVELRRERHAAIRGLRFATERVEADGSATVSVGFEIEWFGGGRPEVSIELIGTDGAQVAVARIESSRAEPAPDTETLAVRLRIERPHLWWTHDLGEPSLYTLRATLRAGGEAVDSRTERVGIRTLELDQSPDPAEPGTRFFRFVLNGRPVFARGANWIPASSFPGVLTAATYDRLIEDAREGRMTMLRVWGGGIYEHDAFYEACDRAGLLVWQDFMFANAPYPENEPFVTNVREEIAYQVRRLRNHPCLALWCGNNEIQWGVAQAAESGGRPGLPGALFYDRIMPEAVRDLDGHTPYWPSSPYGGSRPNDPAEGDAHNWTVWHGLVETPDVAPRPSGGGPAPEDVAFTRYAEDSSRFLSEFGIHAAPVLETLRRIVPADQLYHHSPSLDHHNKDHPKNKVDLLMVSTTGLPRTLEEFVDFSMITQAEGLRFGIEHFRRRSPHCSGALVWQFNDCWPCQSWSLEDYFGFKKAGYYSVRRAFAPLLASFKALSDGSVELWMTNDGPAGVRDAAIVRLGSLSGAVAREERVPFDLAQGANEVVWRAGPVGASPLQPDPGAYLSVRSAGGSFPANRHFFAPIKDLPLPQSAGPEARWTAGGENELVAELRAAAYLFYVHLLSRDERTRFSDNYFDMEAGESRAIAVTSPSGRPDPSLISVAWQPRIRAGDR